MDVTRRQMLAGAAGAAGITALAGCTGDESGADGSEVTGVSSFFVFGEITAAVAGDSATHELLVPVGQHGHGWEPGVRVREQIRATDLLVHGMEGFQPWVDSIRTDLDADGAGVTTVEVSTDVDLLTPGEEHDEAEDHDGGADPHFWMDPLRVRQATTTVRQAFEDADPGNAEAYAANAEAYREVLSSLHDEVASVVEAGDRDVLLVAGHNSHRYLGDRYGLTVEALTGVSPDDSPTLGDIERAREIIRANDLRYICADPLESGQAAQQLVAETAV